MRVFLATRPPTAEAKANGDIVWLDARAKTISRGAATAQLSYSQWMIAAAIIASGGITSSADLISHLYGDLESGGPLSAYSSIHVHLFRARQRLSSVVTLVSWSGHHRGNKNNLGYLAELREAA